MRFLLSRGAMSSLLIAVWIAAGCENSAEKTDDVKEDTDAQSRTNADAIVQPASNCSGNPGAPGLSQREVTVEGTTRSYLVYVPESLDPNSAEPLVFVFHPFGQPAEFMRQLTRFDALAEEEGFIVVFPEGTSELTPWNVGEGVCGLGAIASSSADDFGFVEAMLDAIEAEQCIDRSRVFATGFSMGAYFTHHLGCQRGDLLRAIAPHSGGTYTGDCPGGPMPVLLIHGTSDFIVDPDCGKQARDLWATRNGCSTEFDTEPIQGGHCERQRDCPENGEVVLCLLDGMCHGWAGIGNGVCLDSGGGEQYEDATRLVWNFFQEQL